jgi:hypothetical protein
MTWREAKRQKVSFKKQGTGIKNVKRVKGIEAKGILLRSSQ